MVGILPLCVARGKVDVMPWIPHSFISAMSLYGGPLAALLITLAVPLAVRGKAWADAAAPAALFVGWALLLRASQLPRAIWAPSHGVETLLAPALACLAGVALLAWRGGRQARLIASGLAVFAGWWVARESVGRPDFWRVWFGIGVLAYVVSRIMQGRADRALVLTLALLGCVAVAGTGSAWLLAAAVAAAAAAGLGAAGLSAALPAAAVAALIGASELAGGRLLRGRVGLIDLACLAALASPFIADLAERRLKRLPPQVSAVLSRAIGVGAAVAMTWVLRRAMFT